MLFNYLMGASGFILAGDSIGRAIRSHSVATVPLGVLEMCGGIYFSIAALGGN